MPDYIVNTKDLQNICDWTIDECDTDKTYRIRDYGDEIRVCRDDVDGGDWLQVDTDYPTWQNDLALLRDAGAIIEE